MSATTTARVCLSFLGLVCILRYVMIHSQYVKNSAAMLYVNKYRGYGYYKMTSREEQILPFEGVDLYNLSEEEMEAFFKYKESQVTKKSVGNNLKIHLGTASMYRATCQDVAREMERN